MSSALTARGSTSRWRRIREWILERDGHVCQAPVDGHVCGSPATTVGHIVRREHGGGDGSDNLRAECAGCNYGERLTHPATVTSLSFTQAAIVRALDIAGLPSTAGRRRAAGALKHQGWAAPYRPQDLDVACRWRRVRGPLVRA
jgi:HNH endonuclease